MTCPRKADDLEIRAVGEEVLVHHPSTSKVHILNRIAGQILERCDGARTQQDIVDSICRETGTDREIVAKDVSNVIEEFEQLGLVNKPNAPTDP